MTINYIIVIFYYYKIIKIFNFHIKIIFKKYNFIFLKSNQSQIIN